ncbi:dynamin family protein [Fundidesulfovibrio agrisoli]|uniref:dynamin family protein n=1 Tax=Fundidesulfovibrio agrisoli TaxID=2922717 RepID=UPI001FADEE8A|nr:dynamin family protein [Fundidesulfovibrio agrisoli]
MSAAPTLVDRALAERRAALSALLGGLCSLAERAGRGDVAQDARSLLTAAGEPFLFVAVGEVKTGKSSFINALLGEQAAQVAPDPCTDRIQIISYGPEREFHEEGPLLTRLLLPHPILRDVAVVDTPGVDSVVDRHQEVTERFIPRSDLVLFTFSALNPYTRSAWDFLEQVAGRWRRKVVLVLTQADLASVEQLSVNRRRIAELAREKGLGEPPVFVVSSVLEAVQPELSGIEAVRRHIREMVTGGAHGAAKLESLARGAMGLLDGLDAQGREQRAALAKDQARLSSLLERLDMARDAASREAGLLASQVLRSYDLACADYLAAVELELSFPSMVRRSLGSFFRRRSGVPALLEELARAFRDSLEGRVDALAREGASNLTRNLGLELSQMARDLRELAGPGAAPDAARLDLQREAVLRDVAAGLDAFLASGGQPGRVDPLSVARMDPKAAMGGLMVLAGGLFVLSVKGVVVDVTGGVLAGAGVLLAGGVLAVSRPRLIRRLREELSQGGRRLEDELDALLRARVERIFSDIVALLEPLRAELERRGQALSEQEAQAASLREGFAKALDTPGQTA